MKPLNVTKYLLILRFWVITVVQVAASIFRIEVKLEAADFSKVLESTYKAIRYHNSIHNGQEVTTPT